MTPITSQKLTQLEDLIPETNLVATIGWDVETLAARNNLEFQNSYDDLDFLVFTLLTLPSGDRVALVAHQHAPVPAVEICVRYDLHDVGLAIFQALDLLNLTAEDLTWIEPHIDKKQLNFKITEQELRILEDFAVKTEKTKTDIIREFIRSLQNKI